MCDFDIQNHGSLILFTANTENAREFAPEAFGDAMTLGESYVVEPRYAGDIIDDLLNEQGFSLAIDGQEIAAIN